MAHTTLIVLRGPSGSGKTTVAKAVRDALNEPIALIEQDYLRRTVLKEKDIPYGANIDLMKSVVLFTLSRGYHVILEGILDAGRYGDMLKELVTTHPHPNLFYYFDISFEETLRRHQQKPNHNEFGETEMRRWFKRLDLLTWVHEERIPESNTLEESTSTLLHAITVVTHTTQEILTR